VHATKDENDEKFVDRLVVLRPFSLDDRQEKYKWLKYGKNLRRLADKEVFESKKVLLNATRNAGSAWRIYAAIAPEKLYFSDYFHSASPKDDNVGLEEIVAVLNGPIANAWFDAHCRKRKIVLETLGRLPFPEFSIEARAEVRKLVREIAQAASLKWKISDEHLYDDDLGPIVRYNDLLVRLDAIVARAYGLSDDDVWQISKLVSGDKRPS
jgi:hypothetical protein